MVEVEEAGAEIDQLADRLPTELTEGEDSPGFWLQVAASSLGYRTKSLCESAVRLVDSADFLAAAIIARSALESAATLFYLEKKVHSALETKEFQELDEIVRRAFLGRKDKETDPAIFPLNVLTCLDHLAKLTPSVKEAYAQLSEYAHPNWWGTSGLFCSLSDAPNRATFNDDLEDSKHVEIDALTSVYVSAKLTRTCIGFITDSLPALRAVRETQAGKS